MKPIILLAALAALPVAATAQIVQQKLVASDAEHGDFFGRSVAGDVERIFVGAPHDDDGGNGSGAVYVFERSGATWNEVAKLTASDATAGARFGSALAVDGERAIVATRGDTHPFAYAFERQGSTWVETQKIVLGAPASVGRPGSLALDGERLAIANYYDDTHATDAGIVHVYERQGATWVETAALAPALPAALDRFGASVALDGDRLLAGARGRDVSHGDQGAAFVFEHDGSGWTEVAELLASDPGFNDGFGAAVALDGDRAVVVGFAEDVGGMYVFDRSNDGWMQSAKLAVNDAVQSEVTGCGGNLVLAGNRLGFDCVWTGSSCAGGYPFVFELASDTWTQLGKIPSPSGSVCSDWFGGRLLAPDLLAGTAPGITPATPGGAVFLTDVAALGETLHVEPGAASVTTGTPVKMHLNGGADHALTNALVLGSLSGTTPGFDFGGHHVALEPDAYFFYTLTNVDAPPLDQGLTILDHTGQSVVTFALPPGLSPALAGLTAWHVMAVPNWIDGTLHLASEPVGIPIVQ